MGRSSIGVLLLVAPLACAEATDLELPEAVRDARALLVATRGTDDRIRVLAVEGRMLPRITGSLSSIALLGYTRGLAEISVTPGEQELAPKERARPFPIPAAIEVNELFDGEPIGWRSAPQIPEWLSEVGLPFGLSPEACVEAGGCFTDERALQNGLCTQPCTPAIEPISAPAKVDMTPCPTGWELVERLGHRRCAPPMRLTSVCPVGSAQQLDADRCAPIGPSCAAAGSWPAAPSGTRPRYVRAGAASGGDGSIATPFSDLATALDAAQAGDAVLLTSGAYTALGLELRDGVTLVGLCPGALPEGTRITGGAGFALRVTGTATISGIALIDGGGPAGGGALDVGADAALTLNGVELTGGTTRTAITLRGRLDARELASTGFSSFIDRDASRPLRLRRAAVSSLSGIALVLEGSGSIWISDLAVTNSLHTFYANASAGSRIRVERANFQGHGGYGMAVDGGAAVELSQLLLTHTVRGGAMDFGQAYYQRFGSFRADRVYLADTFHSGLWLYLVEDAELRDVWMETARGPDGAINLQESSADVQRFLAYDVGKAYVLNHAQLTAADTEAHFAGAVLQQLRPRGPAAPHSLARLERTAAFDHEKYGMDVSTGTVSLTDFRLEGGTGGLYVKNASIALHRGHISGQRRMENDTSTGIGMWADELGVLTARSFEVAGTTRGIVLENDRYFLRDGVVRDNAIGVTADQPNYPALSRRLWYKSNGMAILFGLP